MQFFHMRDDETKNWHNYLIIQVLTQEYNNLKAKITQSVACWPVIQNGKLTLVFGFGATINLGEAFGSGETLGEKLHPGDIITVILTDKPQDQLFLIKDGVLSLNFNISDVIAYPFTYSKEMEEAYEVYVSFTRLKDADSPVALKNKTKRLSLR
jgi:hypothetical protein